MKHNNTFFVQVSRKIFTEEYAHLSNNARLLYVYLSELEQRYTGDEKDYFFRSNADLAKDCHMSLPTLKKAKAELIKNGLIQTWQAHFVDQIGIKSKKHITCYRVKR